MPEVWEVLSAVALFLFVLLLAMAIVGLADLMRLLGAVLRVSLLPLEAIEVVDEVWHAAQ
ncbi:MAG: hypothetical protein NZ957_02825 [Thaumarchaeota archaeon]|nr:hypothetical protein [Candidatus Calditenuaceae archaeon]MDW8042243.1 hypothetical protein [Nitrososphaerota archaeon]